MVRARLGRLLVVLVTVLAPVWPGSGPVVARAATAVRVPVLMYHYIRVNPVATDAAGFALSVTPWNFDAQMNYLFTHGVHTVTFDQVYAAVDQGRPLPPNAVVLTFDDGYEDFASTAVPIMQKYGFTAISYVVPGFSGHANYMSVQQLQQVAAAGFTIGAHTMSHLALANLPLGSQEAEIAQSRSVLQQWTGQPVNDFAYPYGSYSGLTELVVAADGFRDAVTTAAGVAESDGNRFTIPRVRVRGGESLATFAASVGPLAPSVAVSGDVRFGRNPLGGVRVNTCSRPSVTTDGNGRFRFYAVIGEAYCLELASPTPPTRLVLNNNPDVSAASSFEYQVAGVTCYHVCPGPAAAWDRSSDQGFQFHFAAATGAAVAGDGHGYVVDSFGDLAPVGNATAAAATGSWPGWSIVRGLVMSPGGTSGYVLDGFGGLHPFGGAPGVQVSAYWPGWDIARAVVLRSDGVSGYVLDGFGALHPFGGAPGVHVSAYWSGWDIARAVVLRTDGVSGWVLDGFGGLHPFGGAPAAQGGPYWPGWDIARGVALVPGTDTGYVLDGFGAVHPFNGAPAVAAPGYWPGWDIARVVCVTSTAVTTVDGYGGVHSVALP